MVSGDAVPGRRRAAPSPRHVPLEGGVGGGGEERADAVARGDPPLPHPLHCRALVRLELGEHQAPPGLGGRVQNCSG